MALAQHVSVEAGLVLLAFTLREHRQAMATPRSRVGRIRATHLGPMNPDQLRFQASLLRLVSTTEATVDALSSELSHRDVPSLDPVVKRLLLEKEVSGTANWGARERMYKRHHGIKLASTVGFKQLMGYVEARNSIAHGLGRLTTRQLDSAETLSRLARVNIKVSQGHVPLASGDVEGCHDICREFLMALDQSV
jgi:hypothetical protein